jgi:hypothetical protein
MSGDSSLGIGIGLALKSYGRGFRGLLNQYPGAAAAYSLRKLSSAVSNVVRVRRASDNDEKDFTALQVSSGELTNWVNSQTVPPLDIGVETSGGRIPVPEGGTSIGIPAAAYSLRNLSTTYTGNVVDVRRSSDDAEDSFTAAEVADGTLTDWVGVGNDGFVTQWYDQSGNDNHATQGTDASQPKIVDGGSLVTGGIDFDGVNDRLSFDSSVSLSTNDFYFASVISILDGNAVNITPVGNAAGNRFLISLNYDIDTAQMRADDGSFLTQPFTIEVPANETLISISNVSNTATLRCENISAAVFNTTGESFTLGNMGQYLPGSYSKHSIKELIIYTSDQSDNRTAIEANIGETYGITGIPAYDNTVDGFVETWYDQSGNGRDATQSVAAGQPKIVDAGVLVSGGIDFDGVNDFLTNSANIFAQTFSVFAVQAGDTDETVGISFSREYFTPNQRITISSDTRTVTKRLANYAPDATDRFINRVSKQSANTEEFITLISDGSNMAAWLDGVSVGAVTSTATPSSPNHGFRIGKQDTGPIYHSGPIQELIIYPSDQSANRVAIETNINDHYNIY